MKILHTVQGYFPYIGGSEELVRKVSEGLVKMGHDVTVYTSFNANRNYDELHGVNIRQFKIEGNLVRGIKGETDEYIHSVCSGDFDIMMNYAAQTWATDLLLPVLEKIKYKKILAPVGYSGLNNSKYHDYFQSLPGYLRKYDCLLYHSAIYQDKLFGDLHGLKNQAIIPNFADESEFIDNGVDFKNKYNIAQKYMLLTVANHYKDKGHGFVIDAFLNANIPDAILVIIGNPTQKYKIYSDCYFECRIREALSRGRIKILTQIPRGDVIGAYVAADLFLFGSKVECSPLVIFEAMASRTPWISTDVGNLSELKNGTIVKNSSSMAEQIRYFLCNDQFRNDVALAVYEEWREKYNFKKILHEYSQLYQNCCQLMKEA